MYPKYKSKYGYYIDEDEIDSYGVDHKNFSIRDELEYQIARQEQENRVSNQHNMSSLMQDNDYFATKDVNINPNWGQKTSEKINEYMQNYDINSNKSDNHIIAPFNDFVRNYRDMRNNNLVGSDGFFHCKANYEAANRGKWGELVGKGLSFGREAYGLTTGDTLSDTINDWRANSMGWNGAKQGLSLQQSCPTDPKNYMDTEYNKKRLKWY